MRRKAITERMKIQCLLYRGLFDCTECDGIIYPWHEIQFDHIHAIVADGPHEYENLRPIHIECHKRKSARDVALNAKSKRIAKGGRKRKGRPMKSRGFQKPPPNYKHRWPKRPMQRPEPPHD